jgi:hypothetical protein
MPTFRYSSLCLLVVALLPLVVLGDEAKTPPALAVLHRRTEGVRSGDRQREGTRLTDVVGRFELAGDRVTFHPANERENYRVLENLALERVGQVLGESRARHEWTVTGVLTEYRGANYLLLQKAVIKAAAEQR